MPQTDVRLSLGESEQYSVTVLTVNASFALNSYELLNGHQSACFRLSTLVFRVLCDEEVLHHQMDLHGLTAI